MAALPRPWQGLELTSPQALDLGTLEAALINQLRASVALYPALGQVEIAHFPDRPEAYRMTHPVGAILLRYDGSRYGPSQDVGYAAQLRTLEWEVLVLTRDLGWAYGGPPSGGSPGAYAILDAVRLALDGFQITGTRRVTLSGDRFQERDKEGGVWIYSMTLEIETLAVQAYTPTAYGTLTQAEALEAGGVTTIAVPAAPYTFNSAGVIQLPYGNVTNVVVTNPQNGEAYVANKDYIVGSVGGTISIVTGGAIPAGATVEVAYSYSEIVTAKASGGSAPTAPSN